MEKHELPAEASTTDLTVPSGRGVWWKLVDMQDGIVVVGPLKRNGHSVASPALERYIVARAEAGCPDCISAILECPNDPYIKLVLNGGHRKVNPSQ